MKTVTTVGRPVGLLLLLLFVSVDLLRYDSDCHIVLLFGLKIDIDSRFRVCVCMCIRYQLSL